MRLERATHEYPQPDGTTTMTAALLLHRADGAPLSSPFRNGAFGTTDPLVYVVQHVPA